METYFPVFPEEEYAARLQKMRAKMEEEGLDACLVSNPENIYYFTGLNHWGYFAYHTLIVHRERKACLIARRMETVTIQNQLASSVEFRGYKDSENAPGFTCNILKEMGLEKSRIGMDMDTLYRSYNDTRELKTGLPEVEWQDMDYFVRSLRFIKSPLEVDAMRQAGVISERMTEAAIHATAAGVNEQAVAAEVYKEMILAGGEPPSFGPFLRPTRRLGEEHTTWARDFLVPGDMLFVEVAGSYHRYHAPMGRLLFVSKAEPGVEKAQAVTLEAFNAVTEKMKPGVIAHDVYRTWQDVVDKAGYDDYKRHHCGYMVGISFPPSWMEGTNRFVSLREGSELVLETGMTFHVMSWMMGSRAGNYFVSNTVAVTEKGSEVLTTTSQNLHIV